MDHERDAPHLTGQIAGVVAMMSALVKALPPLTRKRLLRQTHAEFESLLAAMSATGKIDREGVEWMRDLFLKRITEAHSKQKNRKIPKAAEDAVLSTPPANRSPAVERPSSTEVDLEL